MSPQALLGLLFFAVVFKLELDETLQPNQMTRSLKKGPYVEARLLKKIEGKKPQRKGFR